MRPLWLGVTGQKVPFVNTKRKAEDSERGPNKEVHPTNTVPIPIAPLNFNGELHELQPRNVRMN